MVRLLGETTVILESFFGVEVSLATRSPRVLPDLGRLKRCESRLQISWYVAPSHGSVT